MSEQSVEKADTPWRQMVRRIAAQDIATARAEGYRQGQREARRAAPMTCGISRDRHHPDDYMYDPGQ